MEVTNTFKRLDLIDRMPEELWTEVHYIVQEDEIKTICKKKKRLLESDWCVEELLRSHQGCQYRFALQDGTWDFLEML